MLGLKGSAMKESSLVFYVCKCGYGRHLKGKPREHCKRCRHNLGGSMRRIAHEIVHNNVTYVITTKHKLYSLRAHIIERCYTSKKDRKWYGNINVCKEWRENPLAFYKWAIKSGWILGLTIDRIDPKKDYCPENCRFLTFKENVRRAVSKINATTASLIKQKLKSRGVSEVARDLNISRGIVKGIKAGKSWKDIW